MSDAFDIFDEVDEPVDVNDEQLQRVAALCRRQIDQEDRVKQLDNELKEAKKTLNRTSMELLPLAMEEIGLTGFELDSGEKVTTEAGVTASISAKNKESAFTWLRENDHDTIIKNNVVVNFGKGEDTQATSFLAQCEADGHVVDHKETVHSQTLKAFIKEQLADGEAIPADLFGIHEYTKTKIKRKKG